MSAPSPGVAASLRVHFAVEATRDALLSDDQERVREAFRGFNVATQDAIDAARLDAA